MSYRSVMITDPTYAAIIVCDICKRDMEQMQGAFKRPLTFGQHWELVTHLPVDPENEYANHICSLECLNIWLNNERTHYPGLWLNGKPE